MAIDFGRLARGVTTGYLDAKIRNTEANDALKAKVMENSATIYQTQILPDTIEAEKNRKEVYDQIASATNQNFAELADIGGYTTMKDGYQTALDLYKKTDKKKLEAAMFNTDYNQRYAKRGKTFNEKYEPIFNQIGIKQSGMLGPYTTELMLKEDQQEVTPSVKAGSPEFSSTAIRDYVVDTGTTTLVPEAEFARVAASFRSFQNSISFKPDGGVKFTFKGTKDVEYNALRALTNDLVATGKYTTEDNKANVGRAVEEANFILKQQTQNHIGNNIVKGYFELPQEQTTPGGASYKAQGFSDEFNQSYQTANDKLDYIEDHMAKLGSYSEQKYYAQSFPLGVKININGKEVEVRDYLLSSY